jgi:hypothetical protein
MSTLKLSTLSNLAGSQSTAVENAINGSAKAWVNFNGTGTVAIRASYNVTSITDNGTGYYTVNFTNAMPDINYVTQLASDAAITNLGVFNRILIIATTNVQIHHYENNNLTDTPIMSVAVFR